MATVGSAQVTRKPNWVVRCLNAIFNWFGDFGPMVSAFMGIIGHGLMITVNFLLLIAIVAISWVHSLELLRYAGLTRGLEWVGVFVWETVFIYSSMVLSKDFRNGTSHGWAPWVGFLMGLSFVIVSNYVGMADNTTGKIIGVATPFLLLVIKGLMAHQLRQKNKTSEVGDLENSKVETPENKTEKVEIAPDTLAGETKKNDGKTPSIVAGELQELEAKTPDNKTELKVEEKEEAPAISNISEPENSAKAPADLGLVKTAKNTITTGVSEVEEKEETPIKINIEKQEKLVEAPVDLKPEKLEEEVSSNLKTSKKEVEEKLESEKVEMPNSGVEDSAPKLEDQKVSNLESKLEKPKASKPKVKTIKVKKKTRRSPARSKKKGLDPLEIARKILQEEGEPPGRGRLMKEAGCKEWPARKALDELDAEIALEKAQEILEKKGSLPSIEELQKIAECKAESAQKAVDQLKEFLEVTA